MNRVTRQIFERRSQQRLIEQRSQEDYQGRIQAETRDRVHQETDARASLRQKRTRQRIADEEFAMAERIYEEHREREQRERTERDQAAIAESLATQQRAEVRDEKIRGVTRQNDPEYRELHSKLQMALISQTRDEQRRELAMRRQVQEQERLEQEEQMLRGLREQEEARAAEDAARHETAMQTRFAIQGQIRDGERRRRLLEAAQASRDREQVNAVVQRVATEDQVAVESWRARQQRERQEMIEFMAACDRMKADERRAAEEEERKMKEFRANVDERLARAQDEQRRRDQVRDTIGQRIALDIKRKRDEAQEYENLCLELARQQELQRLKDREAAEARKIQERIAECRSFMEETHRAKLLQAQRSREEELKLKRQIIEQQRRLAELAEIEQEQNRIRIEKFRRELARQMVQKKEMYEAARQEELRRLQIEQEREAERQRILNDERRKLVVSHILSMGPEAVRYLPKGVLKEDDLNYLPEDYRNPVLRQQVGGTTTGTGAGAASLRWSV
jgi:hypothetical protein